MPQPRSKATPSTEKSDKANLFAESLTAMTSLTPQATSLRSTGCAAVFLECAQDILRAQSLSSGIDTLILWFLWLLLMLRSDNYPPEDRDLVPYSSLVAGRRLAFEWRSITRDLQQADRLVRLSATIFLKDRRLLFLWIRNCYSALAFGVFGFYESTGLSTRPSLLSMSA